MLLTHTALTNGAWSWARSWPARCDRACMRSGKGGGPSSAASTRLRRTCSRGKLQSSGLLVSVCSDLLFMIWVTCKGVIYLPEEATYGDARLGAQMHLCTWHCLASISLSSSVQCLFVCKLHHYGHSGSAHSALCMGKLAGTHCCCRHKALSRLRCHNCWVVSLCPLLVP